MSFTLWGVPGTLATLVAWAAAVVVFRTGPDRPLNRRLAFLLLVEGIWFSGSLGALFFLESARAVHVAAQIGTAASVAASFLYLAFLGAGLPTPLVAPLRTKLAFHSLVLLAAMAAASVFAFPAAFVTEPYPAGWAPWNFRLVGIGQTFSQLQGLIYLYGFLAAVSVASKTHCCDVMRRQAFWFAAAFGTRDFYIGLSLLVYPLVRPVPFWGDFLYNPMEGLAYLAYVVLLCYGVLQAQLFDIQIRLRVAVRRSTLVALIAAVFFLASELVEEFVPVDGTLLGIIAAGLIVLCLQPLQRLAERLVNRLMPRHRPNEGELEARKLDVYQAALEGALQDGVVTEREQQILARLRRELEISEAEEAEVRSRIAAADGVAT